MAIDLNALIRGDDAEWQRADEELCDAVSSTAWQIVGGRYLFEILCKVTPEVIEDFRHNHVHRCQRLEDIFQILQEITNTRVAALRPNAEARRLASIGLTADRALDIATLQQGDDHKWGRWELRFKPILDELVIDILRGKRVREAQEIVERALPEFRRSVTA